jgi:ArsR family transcriptional regulator
MTRAPLAPAVLDLVADRFRVLGEAARLALLQALRDAPRTVGELADRTGLSPANVSKHLQILHAARFVVRRKDGLHVYYALAGADVFRLCDIMCERLAAEARRQQEALAP